MKNIKVLQKIEQIWSLLEEIKIEIWDDFIYFIEVLEKHIHNNYK